MFFELKFKIMGHILPKFSRFHKKLLELIQLIRLSHDFLPDEGLQGASVRHASE